MEDMPASKKNARPPLMQARDLISIGLRHRRLVMHYVSWPVRGRAALSFPAAATLQGKHQDTRQTRARGLRGDRR